MNAAEFFRADTEGGFRDWAEFFWEASEDLRVLLAWLLGALITSGLGVASWLLFQETDPVWWWVGGTLGLMAVSGAVGLVRKG